MVKPVWVLGLALVLAGCATEQQLRYKAAAEAESFDRFFASPADVNLKDPLEKTLLHAISVTSVFLVFYEGRGASISDFYRDAEFRYSSNSQIKTFGYKDAEYTATYPMG